MGAAVLSDTLSPPTLISAALNHTQPSVSAALCVSLTPVLHPQHPPQRLGSQSEPVSLEGYLVWGLCRADGRLSRVLLRG